MNVLTVILLYGTGWFGDMSLLVMSGSFVTTRTLAGFRQLLFSGYDATSLAVLI